MTLASNKRRRSNECEATGDAHHTDSFGSWRAGGAAAADQAEATGKDADGTTDSPDPGNLVVRIDHIGTIVSSEGEASMSAKRQALVTILVLILLLLIFGLALVAVEIREERSQCKATIWGYQELIQSYGEVISGYEQTLFNAKQAAEIDQETIRLLVETNQINQETIRVLLEVVGK